jgi:hypothetical protein
MQSITCDRCGENFSYPTIVNAMIDELAQNGGVYKITRETVGDYGKIKIDLCPECLRKLRKWVEGANA